MTTGRRRAGKGDLGDVGMRGQRLARLFAVAVHHVQHAGRQQVLNQFNKQRNAQRRLLSWFQHHAVARTQRRRQLPRRHQQREVPGDNLRHHAQWFMEMIGGGKLINLSGRALLRPHAASEIAEMIHRQRHIGGQRFAHRLTVIPGLIHRHIFEVLLQPISDPEQCQRTLLRRRFTPGFGCGLRRGDGIVHVCLVRTREFPCHRTVNRRRVGEVVPVHRRHEFAVDKIAVGFLEVNQRTLFSGRGVTHGESPYRSGTETTMKLAVNNE